jgi:hypothetical protein
LASRRRRWREGQARRRTREERRERRVEGGRAVALWKGGKEGGREERVSGLVCI